MIKKNFEDTLFGLELEFTGITREKAAKIVASTLSSNKISSFQGWSSSYNVEDSSSRIWNIKYDSSINTMHSDRSACSDSEYAVELVTPKLTLKDLETLMKIVDNLKICGAIANNSCGLHIHVDASKQTTASMEYLLDQMFLNQDMLFSALKVNPHRESYCSELTPELIYHVERDKRETLEELEENYENSRYYGAHQSGARYRNLNLENAFSHNTDENHLEYRFFNSTFNTPLIRAYIKFCLAFSQSGIDKMNNRHDSRHLSSQDVIIRLIHKIMPNRATTLSNLRKVDAIHHKRRETGDYDRKELDLYLKSISVPKKDRQVLSQGLKLHSERKLTEIKPDIIFS